MQRGGLRLANDRSIDPCEPLIVFEVKHGQLCKTFTCTMYDAGMDDAYRFDSGILYYLGLKAPILFSSFLHAPRKLSVS